MRDREIVEERSVGTLVSKYCELKVNAISGIILLMCELCATQKTNTAHRKRYIDKQSLLQVEGPLETFGSGHLV